MIVIQYLHAAAHAIPQGSAFLNGLSSDACGIANHLARLSNVPQHRERRDAALQLFGRWQQPDVGQLMQYLLGEPRLPATLDWVQQIGCCLPAFALLKGLGFSTTAAEAIVYVLPDLVNIMHPIKSEAEALAANRAAEMISAPLHDYVMNVIATKDRREAEMYRSNLAGLLIQSFDAGRGAFEQRDCCGPCAMRPLIMRSLVRMHLCVRYCAWTRLFRIPGVRY